MQFGNVGMYRKVANDPATVARYARDLPADRWDTVLFDHALLGLGLGIGLLCLVFGWQLGLLAAGVHAVTYLLLNGAINAVGHTLRPPPLQRLRHQQPVAGLADRRRGPAQQPPRGPDLGPAGPRAATSWTRVVVHPARPPARLADRPPPRPRTLRDTVEQERRRRPPRTVGGATATHRTGPRRSRRPGIGRE